MDWKTLLLSETLVKKRGSHKIAYIAVMTAFSVVANMFFEFKLAETQFSLTLLVSFLTGIIIGPLFGFVACFLGDLVGFLYHSAGFAYMPWIGISMGLTAVLGGLIVNGLHSKKPWFLYVKLALVCLLSFTVCTVLINTTAFWLLYSKVDYATYLVSRLFVQGQIWNCLVNYILLFVSAPALAKIKPLKIKIS
jgi:ECF transporter S component (folate family)